MDKKIKVLLVSVSFKSKSGIGIIEHGVRIRDNFRKYNKNVAIRTYNLTNSKLFYYVNKNFRGYTTKEEDEEEKSKIKPDIIHYMSPGIFLSSSFIKPFFNFKAKQIVTIHDLDMIKKIPKIGIKEYTNIDKYSIETAVPMSVIGRIAHFAEKTGLKLAVKKADHFICVSENTKKDLIRLFKIKEEKISVVYNIINKEFKHLPKKKGEKIIIGHLSSYAYNKNAEMLVKAFKKVKSDKFELHLYGAKLPFDISDDKRIKYFGYADDLVKMYNSFDVFVFPSLWEGFGMPVMEAKRCKIPVITYKKGELPDIVKRNTLQFDNKEDLTRIIENKEWKKIDIEKAYKDTMECSEIKIIKQIEDVYKKVLEEK